MKKKDVEESFEVMFVPEEEIEQVSKVRGIQSQGILEKQLLVCSL